MPWTTAFLLCIGLLVCSVVAGAQTPLPTPPPTDGTITVPIKNLQNIGKGQLIVLLFKKIKRIEPELTRAYQSRIQRVSGKRMTTTFKNIPFGEYAVSVLHDMDKDREMDTNFFGVPDEDLGCSNNAKGGPLGGPKWAEAKFRHTTPANKLTTIEMWQCYD